jgi:uncharacterized glyoxalase superfamily protein PhnB
MQGIPKKDYRREGMNSINPYPVVKDGEAFLSFLQQVFGGELKARHNRPDGRIMHCEVRVDDVTVEFGEGNDQYPAAPMAFHVYVPDADEVYRRAIEAGAVSLHPLTDQTYGDREGSVRDSQGNNWYIATHLVQAHKPERLRTLTPYLHASGADSLIRFVQSAFGGEPYEVHRGEQGDVIHAKVRIGDSVLELSEAHGQWGPIGANLHVYVPDTDAAYSAALASGATSQAPPSDTPYGDRAAAVVDAWGNQWWLATNLRAGE